MKNLIYLIGLSVMFYSCKKEPDPHEDEEPDTTNPVVNLTSPSDSTYYNSGDTVFISGSVTDNELHSGTIRITNDSTAAVLYSQDHYVHELPSATFSYYYIVSVTQPVAATLNVTYQDHQPNSGMKTRRLFFLP